MGYGLEIDLIRAAHELDLLTTPYVFDAEQARDMTRGRRRHHRLPHGPDHRRRDRRGNRRSTLEDCVPRINEWAAAARRVRKDVIVLCHGGPIATPADAAYILDACPDCHGFYGASSMERLPTEVAITEQTRQFKRIARQREAVQIGRRLGR